MACILIVDDEPETRYALCRVLDSAGHRVLDASTARDALELLGCTAVDLIVCDVHLPEDTGIGLVAEAHRHAPQITIVAIARSGLAASAHQVERARRSGAREVLHTPFDSETLIKKVDRALQGQATRHGAVPAGALLARHALG